MAGVAAIAATGNAAAVIATSRDAGRGRRVVLATLLAADALLSAAHWLWRGARAGVSPRWFDLTATPSFGGWLLSMQFLCAAILAARWSLSEPSRRGRTIARAGAALLLLFSLVVSTNAHVRLDLAGSDFSSRLPVTLVCIAVVVVAADRLGGTAIPFAAVSIMALVAWQASTRMGGVSGSGVAVALSLFGTTALLGALQSRLRDIPMVPLYAAVLAAIAAGALHLFASELDAGGIRWFDLDRERNVGTWLSSGIFLLLALEAWRAWGHERARPESFQMPALWLVVGFIAVAMSLDESTMLHENSRALLGATSGAARYLIQWQLVLAPLFLLAFAYLAAFLMSRYATSSRARALAIFGLLTWLASQAVEGIHPRFMSAGDWQYRLIVLVEELAELFGAIALIASIRAYLASPAVPWRLRAFTRRGLIAAVAATTLFGLAALLVVSLARPQIVSPGQAAR